MNKENIIKLRVRILYREENDLTPPKILTDKERELWNEEAHIIALEENQSAIH